MSFGDRLVEITGGEPLLQPEALPLMKHLADRGLTVLLETSGSIDVAPVDSRVRIILNVRTPGSGESEANLWSNLDRLKETDEVKFVVVDRADFDWSIDLIRRRRLFERCPVLIERGVRQGRAARLGRMDLGIQTAVAYQTQLHKLIWAPNAIGV